MMTSQVSCLFKVMLDMHVLISSSQGSFELDVLWLIFTDEKIKLRKVKPLVQEKVAVT